VSNWGHDFRVSYRALSSVRSQFPDLPILACTATATIAVQNDVCGVLGLRPGLLVVRSTFDRPNLQFVFQSRQGRGFDALLPILAQYSPEKCIVYVRKRALCLEIAEFLNKLKKPGVKAVAYNAEMSLEGEKKKKKKGFFDF
jgi:superfamily II DNA helicase RecQ